MRQLAEKILQAIELSNNTIYDEIEAVEEVLQNWQELQTKDLTEEIKRVTKKASILEYDNFRLIEKLESI
jgi:hypothetical protein